MKLFYKRIGLIQNITLMALLSSINVIFVLISTFVPFLSFLLILLLPLTSILITLFGEKKYYPYYALTTIALCIAITFYNLSDLLFFVIPSLLSGFVFGLLIDKKIDTTFLILITSMINFICAIVSIPLINFLYKVNLVETFLNLFKLNGNQTITFIVPSFIFLLSLIQTTISTSVLKEELKKFDIHIKENGITLSIISSLISLTLMLIFCFISLKISYLFFFICLFFNCSLFISSLESKKVWLLIIETICIVISIILFLILSSKVPKNFSILLLSSSCLMIDIVLLFGIKSNALK